jgi:hypothetical protein
MSSGKYSAVPSPNLQAILSAALANYSRQTGKDLQSDPLAEEIRCCKSPNDILNILKKHAEKLDKSDSNLMNYLDHIVNGLYTLSTNMVLGAGASLVSQSRFVCSLLPILTVVAGVPARTFSLFWYQRPSRRAYLPCYVYLSIYDIWVL